MERTKRGKFSKNRFVLFILLFMLLSGALIAVAVYTRFANLDNRSEASSDQGLEFAGDQESESNPPELLNIPAKSVVEGEKYTFPAKIVDSDTEPANLELRLSEGPAWLYMTDDNILYGYPRQEHVGVHKIVLTVTDGKNVERNEFYIEVKESSSAK
ncbi:hypothetical protein GF357_01270 [Candidatus Dojkabacteria bacterium]|nr:hypothetical protein [Candidatus Dojkabacteria bacterium]